MRIALVFPPPWEPTMPYLAPAALAASLSAAGHEPDIADAALDYVHHLLLPETINSFAVAIDHSDRLRAVIARGRPERISGLLARAARLARAAPAALDVLQRADLFRHSELRAMAWHTLLAVHQLAGQAHSPSQLAPDTFSSSYHLLRPTDVIALADDSRVNPFRTYLRDIAAPKILAEHPDTIAISVAGPSQLAAAVTLARLIRSKVSGLPILAGGAFLTAIASDLERHPLLVSQFDAIFTGEGERTLAEWCGRWPRLRPDGIRGAIYSRDGRIVSVPPEVASSANVWPTPDFSTVSLSSYLSPAPVFPLLTQRGCYYRRCAFCSGTLVHDGRFRERPAELVVNDLLQLSARQGCRYISITDQAVTPRMLALLAKELANHSHLNLRWFAQVRIEPALTSDLLQRIYRAGCRLLVFGIESANDRERTLMDKGGSFQLVRRIIDDCARVGIAVHLFLIAGFPGETEDEARGSVTEICGLATAPGSTAFIHPFVVERGSRVFAAPDRYGVRLVSPAPDSIPYQFDYEVRAGITPERVQHILPELATELSRRFPGPTPSLAHSLLSIAHEDAGDLRGVC